ncbi:MAG: STAS domain-containing protein [Lachnospiraceae bacterium]|nr:STAS domain-containing protein [Lachnospiraceae bacterium]
MTIEARKEQEKLTLKLKGRLDTTTAGQLEEALRDYLDGTGNLVLDFTLLEYISSAGLRVLLAAHKAMKKQEGTMVVKGANEEVREVFTITGFADILNVE